ncbi:molybdopterin molybdenumtransferase MoeA [Rhodococcus rhodnii]|uniref:Molybdopterin molybdenumtransferase n=2 Tax=Rhodococcus rhodnii TaxID=38312 RepID=R7WLS9_9NOCA|nr:gephyrin-like molybdotransferase Glp [Rhodococcus rhodnii]EOM76252.1 molybdopterin biosynthesis protein [Rhodococcus rhodnii LMG 5362]TXG90731.1 molybdopterin molybdenumtransferase MoeA [Rhodococcus rhodnii]
MSAQHDERRTVAEHAEHVTELLAGLTELGHDDVRLTAALGRATATDVVASIDLPPFRNSQMDGYAVTAASVADAPVTLPSTDVVPAGPGAPLSLAPGTAIRIMTGGVLPDGADAVIPVEDTHRAGDAVEILRGRAEGEFVRERGSDVTAGTVLLPAGTLLEPRHVALLAAVGLSTVAVLRRPRVAVLTTGAELVPAGTTLGPGEIYDSNGTALAASVLANGGEVVLQTRSSDEPAEFAALLAEATRSADLVLTSGGVSMGDFEVVKDSLAPRGSWFGHVAMQPGGPQGSGMIDGVPVLNFPGNPVSTLVSFDVFARPVLRAAAGLPPIDPRHALLAVALRSPAGKRQFLRGRWSGGRVETVAGPSSHLVAAMAWADVLIDVPADTTELAAGESVTVLPLSPAVPSPTRQESS